jgi:hypothetical protein
MRLVVGRRVADHARVEDHEVGRVALLQQTAPLELEVLRR